MTPLEAARAAVEELRDVVDALDPTQLDDVIDRLDDAGSVFFSGHGRSGLMARAISMRMMHLGLRSFVVGETATPAIGPGDVLVVLSATGRGAPAAAQSETARSSGATVITFSSSRDTPLASSSDVVVEVPARTRVTTAQHAGSLFEQACLVIGDAICRALQSRRGVSTAEMDARHSNLQ